MFAALTLQALMVMVPAPREEETSDKGPAFFGVWCYPSDKNDGLLIREVIEKSPAEKAGVKVNDLMLTFNGKKYLDGKELSKEILALRPGTTLPLHIVRDGKEMTLKVRLGVRPVSIPLPEEEQPIPSLPEELKRR